MNQRFIAQIVFIFCSAFQEQYAMRSSSNVSLPKRFNSFTKNFLQMTRRDQHPVLAVRLLTQIPLDELLKNRLIELRKKNAVPVAVLASKFVHLFGQQKLSQVKQQGIDVVCFPDEYSKYKVEFDKKEKSFFGIDEKGSEDSKLEKEYHDFVTQVALISYPQKRVLVLPETASPSIIHENIVDFVSTAVFNEMEQKFEEIKRQSQK